MKILVTAGATREPIDAVRYLSNLSTGATGAALAEAFVAARHQVTLLRGHGSVHAGAATDDEVFSSAQDLAIRLERRLRSGDYELVVMSAAVADFRPESAATGKISSHVEEMTLRLVRNAKILPRLKGFSPRPLLVVGFKLTAGADEKARREAIAEQFSTGGVDAIVHNDLEEIRQVARSQHLFRFYRAATAAPEATSGATALAAVILREAKNLETRPRPSAVADSAQRLG